MDAAWQPPAPTGSWTVSRRLVLRPVPWDAVQAITAGRRLPGWADDYPAEGDAMIAGLLFRAGPAAWPGANQAWGHRQVVERATGLVVGGIGFAGPPGAAGEVELGYGIVPSRQGRGYATEAVAAMVAVAWADPVVEAVVATTAPATWRPSGCWRRPVSGWWPRTRNSGSGCPGRAEPYCAGGAVPSRRQRYGAASRRSSFSGPQEPRGYGTALGGCCCSGADTSHSRSIPYASVNSA